jgi:hypothetical protein
MALRLSGYSLHASRMRPISSLLKGNVGDSVIIGGLSFAAGFESIQLLS